MSDTAGGLGAEELLRYPNVFCPNKTAGTSTLSKVRLSEKVLENLRVYLEAPL